MIEAVEGWLARFERGEVDRRGFLRGVTALMAAAPAPAGSPAVSASGLHHVEIKTMNLARTSAFYTALFGPAAETRDDRVIIPLGSGAGRGYLSIGIGPIPRVDHFSVKAPGMHLRNPQATAARLSKAGHQVRQLGSSIFVMDPDKHEVELQAPSVRPY